MIAFQHESYDAGPIALRRLSGEAADTLGGALAAMPPWSVIGWSAERMVRAIGRDLPGIYRFEVRAQNQLAGIVTIQNPFLHGPYLQLLAVLPAFQGQKIGLTLLDWMETQAREQESRQLWLCVSTFNTRARAFYERFGFEAVAVLDRLASEVSDELFMRKRLAYPAG
jgi:ribosomal protein S18 acetylase RimI-like enzyme